MRVMVTMAMTTMITIMVEVVVNDCDNGDDDVVMMLIIMIITMMARATAKVMMMMMMMKVVKMTMMMMMTVMTTTMMMMMTMTMTMMVRMMMMMMMVTVTVTMTMMMVMKMMLVVVVMMMVMMIMMMMVEVMMVMVMMMMVMMMVEVMMVMMMMIMIVVIIILTAHSEGYNNKKTRPHHLNVHPNLEYGTTDHKPKSRPHQRRGEENPEVDWRRLWRHILIQVRGSQSVQRCRPSSHDHLRRAEDEQVVPVHIVAREARGRDVILCAVHVTNVSGPGAKGLDIRFVATANDVRKGKEQSSQPCEDG